MSAPNIALINYGAGNLRSVSKALESLGANVLVTSDPAEIAAADGLVLPGQGACDTAMVALEAHNLTESVGRPSSMKSRSSAFALGCNCSSTTRKRRTPSVSGSFPAGCGGSRRG